MQIQSTAPTEPQKKNRIQVSNTKKPLFFYVNLAKIEIVLGKSEKFESLMTTAVAAATTPTTTEPSTAYFFGLRVK
ncbi:hypothetical protein SO802_018939 [Lithocarpus litseifolius]|uniref:Uncharacterized protein n=1 Tax=Lithocarpus litseifolius TaxID=425828 RepID=A0AAW2CMS7_9ROSI